MTEREVARRIKVMNRSTFSVYTLLSKRSPSVAWWLEACSVKEAPSQSTDTWCWWELDLNDFMKWDLLMRCLIGHQQASTVEGMKRWQWVVKCAVLYQSWKAGEMLKCDSMFVKIADKEILVFSTILLNSIAQCSLCYSGHTISSLNIISTDRCNGVNRCKICLPPRHAMSGSPPNRIMCNKLSV